MKRLISCILVVCILASMLVTTAVAGPSDPLTLTDTVILNDTQVLLVFSEPVNDPATWGTFNAIRLVDNDDNLMWTGAANTSTPLQFNGTVTYQFADINKNMVVWTKTDGAATIYDMLNKTGAIVTDGWDSLYEKVVFCIEQGSGARDGQIHGVTSADGSKILQGRQWTDTGIGENDRLYTEMREPVDVTYTAQMLSESRIRLTFSEAIDVKPGTWLSLRYVDDNNQLQWTGEPEAEGSTALQWSGDWAYEDDAHTSIIWTIHQVHNKLISDIMNFVGSADGVDFSTLEGIQCKFVIEEGGDSGVTVNRDGHVTNVVGRTGNLLQANNLNATGVSDGRYVSVSPVESPCQIKSVSAISSARLRVTFTEPVEFSGSPFMALRIVDANNNLQWSGETPLQVSGSWEYADENHDSIIWQAHANQVSSTSDFINRTGDYAAFSQYLTMFCIEEIPTTDAGNLEPGAIDNIIGETSGERLYANKPSLGRDGVYVSVASFEPSLFVESVSTVSTTRLQITFTEPVEIGNPFMALRIVDENNNLQWTGEPDAEGSLPLQISGSWKYADENQDSIIWQADPGQVFSINDFINRTGDYAAYAQYKTMFCIEEDLDPAYAAEFGVIDDIMSAATGEKLFANTPNSSGFYERVYMPVEAFETSLSIKSVSTISTAKLRITFSEPVEIGNPFMALRIVDEYNNLQWEGVPEAEGSTPLQISGSWQYADENHDSIIWKAHSGQVSNINDFINRTGDYAAYAQYKTMFCIEELLDEGYDAEFGLMDDITSVATGEKLPANKPNASGVYERVYVPVKPFQNSLFIESVEPVSAYQLRITFTEPVNISGEPFMALRLVDENNNLQWTGEPEAEGSEPLQWSGSWKYENSDRTSIIWTLHNGILASMNDAINRTGALADFSEFRTMFCIEELLAEDYDAEFGVIDNITSRATGEKLYANTPNTSGFYERVYLPVEPYEPNLSITEVRAISPDKLRVQFSEPVDIVGDPFMALRFVDDNNQLQWTGEPEKSDPMQFYGTWAYESDKKDAIIWTLNGGGFFIPVDNVTDIINRTGNAWGYRHLNTKFCIEEVLLDPDAGNMYPGTIDNIRSIATGEQLYANKPSMGLDGVYVDATPYYPSFYITRAIAYSDKEIMIEFSAPIRVKGSPFMALRIVDELNNLQWEGAVNEGTPIQFGGTWKFADADHDRIIWTLNDQGHPVNVSSVAEIINREGAMEQYSGYRTRFCIEEKPFRDENDTNHWAISNITNAYGTMLYANKNSADGAWDGAYVRVAIDMGYNPFTVDANVWLFTSIASVMAACGVSLAILRKKRLRAKMDLL